MATMERKVETILDSEESHMRTLEKDLMRELSYLKERVQRCTGLEETMNAVTWILGYAQDMNSTLTEMKNSGELIEWLKYILKSENKPNEKNNFSKALRRAKALCLLV